MNKLDIKDRIGMLHYLASDLAEQWRDKGFFRNCINCSYFQQNPANEMQYYCEKNEQPPPPRIIANGCEQHSDLIPF